MKDIILLLILIIVTLFFIIKTFNPNIEIVELGQRKFKVLLWYNSLEGKTLERKYVRLFGNEMKRK